MLPPALCDQSCLTHPPHSKACELLSYASEFALLPARRGDDEALQRLATEVRSELDIKVRQLRKALNTLAGGLITTRLRIPSSRRRTPRSKSHRLFSLPRCVPLLSALRRMG